MFQLNFCFRLRLNGLVNFRLINKLGAGKTPSSKVFLGPLMDLERREKLEFDRNKMEGDKEMLIN